ncbi:phasin family protein [Niveispirillum lacus]|nr:phasin family protein [Niveispirillum lacus]
MATRTPKSPVVAATPKKAVTKPTPVQSVDSGAAQADVTPTDVTIVSPPAAPVAQVVEDVVPAPAAPLEPKLETPVTADADPALPVVEPKPVAKVTTPKATQAAARKIETPAKPVDQTIAQTKEKVEKMSKQVFATFEDVVGFQKENVEAFVASSTILTKGFEALSKEIAAFTQAQYEQSVATTKALFAVKSVKELVDLQTEFAKSSFDALVAEATKVSETGIKVANEAAEPITARVNAAVEKLSKLKAA